MDLRSTISPLKTIKEPLKTPIYAYSSCKGRVKIAE